MKAYAFPFVVAALIGCAGTPQTPCERPSLRKIVSEQQGVIPWDSNDVYYEHKDSLQRRHAEWIVGTRGDAYLTCPMSPEDEERFFVGLENKFFVERLPYSTR